MKNKFLFLLLFVFLTDVQFAQTITLQPGPSYGKDSRIFNMACGINPGLGCDTTNYGSDDFFQANAWTFSSSFAICRSFLEFDLSSVNVSSSNISSATLFLYFPPDQATYETHSIISGSNAVNIDRVVQSWSETGIRWINQPNVVTSNLNDPQNRITIPASTSPLQDFSIDITSMLQYWLTNPTQNFGIRLSLATEQYYRRMTFATSDHAIASIRPKLVINYTGTDHVTSFEKNNIEIISNPVKNSIHFKAFESGNSFKFEIYSLEGKLMASTLFENNAIEHDFPVGNLTNGLYMIRISDANGNQKSGKILISN